MRELIPSENSNDEEVKKFLNDKILVGATDNYAGTLSIGFKGQGIFTLEGLTSYAAEQLARKRDGYYVGCELAEGDPTFWANAAWGCR